MRVKLDYDAMNTTNQPSHRRTFLKQSALAALAAPWLTPSAGSAAETAQAGPAPLRIAVVTGGHTYDVLNFHKLFRALPGVDAYVQHMEDFVATPDPVRDQYAVVLFYHMLMQGPPDGPVKTALEHLGATEQGVVVLHHALLAYPQWTPWSDLVGIADRKFGFHYGQTLQVQIANRNHPITRNLEPWTMGDETYTMADAGQDSDVLLTAEHPRSMKTLAWTRQFRKSRVLCLQSGHDAVTWDNPGFRTVLGRGLLWCARRA